VAHPTLLADLLGASVLTAGARVGVIQDVYVDRTVTHLIGAEVVGPNGRRWYLPWATAKLEDGAIHAASPLVFMPLEQVGFYIEHGMRLDPRDVDGLSVDAAGVLSRSSAEACAEAEPEGTGVA
jgi:PRC-barrel domain